MAVPGVPTELGPPEEAGSMRHPKVRCVYCGAKNSDPELDRCRICGGLLPDAAQRRKQTRDPGESFKTIVEAEVATWREYGGRLGSTVKSRRPAELPPLDALRGISGDERDTGS